MAKNTNEMNKIIALSTELDKADSATCVIPSETDVMLCTFLDKNKPLLTIGMGYNKDMFSFFKYLGNNKDLALRYANEKDYKRKINLVKTCGFSNGGCCFKENGKEECIVMTSGTYEAVSRDGEQIYFKDLLSDIKKMKNWDFKNEKTHR